MKIAVSGERVRAELVDLSARGAGILVERPLEAGTEILVHFRARGARVDLHACVLSSRASGRADLPYRIACELDAPAVELVESLFAPKA